MAALECCLYTQWDSIEKTIFFLCEQFLLELASCLGMRDHVHFSSQCWNFTLTRPAVAICVFLSASVLLCLECLVCLVSSTILLGSCNLSLFLKIPWALQEGIWLRNTTEDCVISNSYLSSYSPVFSVFSLYFPPSNAGGNFSDEGWGRYRSMGIAECHQESLHCCIALPEQ